MKIEYVLVLVLVLMFVAVVVSIVAPGTPAVFAQALQAPLQNAMQVAP